MQIAAEPNNQYALGCLTYLPLNSPIYSGVCNLCQPSCLSACLPARPERMTNENSSLFYKTRDFELHPFAVGSFSVHNF